MVSWNMVTIGSGIELSHVWRQYFTYISADKLSIKLQENKTCQWNLKRKKQTLSCHENTFEIVYKTTIILLAPRFRDTCIGALNGSMSKTKV